MAIDNLGLTTITNKVNEELENAFLEKPISLSTSQFAFTYHRGHNTANKGRGVFIISLDPSTPFICYSYDRYTKINSSSPFSVSLKKLSGCLVKRIYKVTGERIVIIDLETSNNDVLSLNTGYQVVVELFPQRPNCYIIPLPSNKVSSLYKEKSDVFSDRYTSHGLPYILPEKRNPISKDLDDIDEAKKYLSRSTFKNFEQYIKDRDFKTGLSDLIDSKKLFLIDNRIEPFNFGNPKAEEIKVQDIYSFYVSDQKGLAKKSNQSELLNKLNHLITVTTKKTKNLQKDLAKAKTHVKYMEYGQELFLHQTEYKKGMTSMDVDGYHIPLDPKVGIITNANKYFKKYHKSKAALVILGPLIEKTKYETTYLKEKLLQIDKGSFNDIKELKVELELEGYLKAKPKKHETTKKGSIKKSKPHYLKSNDYKIGFGMNALQNESLTFEIAPRTCQFLHVANYPGSHVVILEGNNNETRLLAAELALYLSNLDSGDIQIAPVKKVKKNKTKLGLVNLLEYKLISLKKIRPESIKLFEQSIK